MKQYRSFRVSRMLVEALLNRLEEFAEEGILVHRIICQRFYKGGYKFVPKPGHAISTPSLPFGEIYYLDLRDSALIKARPRLFKALLALS
jgi:hypothetical protein